LGWLLTCPRRRCRAHRRHRDVLRARHPQSRSPMRLAAVQHRCVRQRAECAAGRSGAHRCCADGPTGRGRLGRRRRQGQPRWAGGGAVRFPRRAGRRARRWSARTA